MTTYDLEANAVTIECGLCLKTITERDSQKGLCSRCTGQQGAMLKCPGLRVSCPMCRVQAGHGCLWLGKRTKRNTSHSARIRKALKKQGET